MKPDHIFDIIRVNKDKESNMSDYIDIQDVYLNHDLCGVERNTSISLLGRLTLDEMEKLDSVKLDLNEVGWPSEINETDIEFNKRFNIDLDESVKDEDFVKMSDLPFYQEMRKMKSVNC